MSSRRQPAAAAVRAPLEPDGPPRRRLRSRLVGKPDGRYLILYERPPGVAAPVPAAARRHG